MSEEPTPIRAPREGSTDCLHCRLTAAIVRWQDEQGLKGVPLELLAAALADVVAVVATAGFAPPGQVVALFATRLNARIARAQAPTAAAPTAPAPTSLH